MDPDQFEQFFADQVNPKGPFGFPAEVADDITGLRHLGYLTEEIEFCGHTITLKLLNADEEVAAAQACQPARNTIKEPEAWARAIIGLALSSVDGEEDFCPPTGPDLVAFAKARYRYTGRWFWPTIDYYYQQYAKLVQRQVEAVRAFQDFSSRSLGPDLPSLGFSTGLGASDEQTSSAILD